MGTRKEEGGVKVKIACGVSSVSNLISNNVHTAVIFKEKLGVYDEMVTAQNCDKLSSFEHSLHLIFFHLCKN